MDFSPAFFLYLSAGLLLTLIVISQAILLWPALFTGLVNRLIAAAGLPEFRFRLKGKIRGFGFIFFGGGPLRLDIRDDYLGYILRLDVPSFGFQLNPAALLIGRVRVSGLTLRQPRMRVRVFRHRRKIDPEIRPLPDFGTVFVSGIRITGGHVHIHDTTILTPLRLDVREINIKGGRFDAGVPISLFFLSREGHAFLDEAPIAINLKNGKGRLNIQGLDLRALAGIGSFLIREGLLDLDFPYELKEKRLIGGEVDMRLRNFRSSLQSRGDAPAVDSKAVTPANAVAEAETKSSPADGDNTDEVYTQLWEAARKTSEYGRVFPFSFDLKDFPGMFDQSLQGLLRRLFKDFAVQTVKQPVLAAMSSAFRGISSLFGKNKAAVEEEPEPRRGFMARLFRRDTKPSRPESDNDSKDEPA